MTGKNEFGHVYEL